MHQGAVKYAATTSTSRRRAADLETIDDCGYQDGRGGDLFSSKNCERAAPVFRNLGKVPASALE
jgi:hypothetical protein